MKNLIFFIFCMIVVAPSYSQTRKTTVKRNIKQVVKKSESQIVKENALSWFKDTYVKQYFKDPYSFRLMNETVTPVTTSEFLEMSKKEAEEEMKAQHLHPNDANQAALEDCEKEYNESMSYYRLWKDSSDKTKSGKAAIHKEYADKFAELIKSIKLYLLAEEQYKKAESDLASLSPELATKTIHYSVQIDCYSKNGMGNEVLGRYVFPFSVDGTPLSFTLLKIKNLNE